jgi:hypothetical protein
VVEKDGRCRLYWFQIVDLVTHGSIELGST